MKDEQRQGRSGDQAGARRGRSDSSFILLTSSFCLKRWRRTLLLASLLLLAGAVVNVAVAWGFRAADDLTTGQLDAGFAPWHVSLDRFAREAGLSPPEPMDPISHVFASQGHSRGVSASFEGDSALGSCATVAAGWPWRSLAMSRLVDSSGNVFASRGALILFGSRSSSLTQAYGLDGAYPCGPLLPGFLLNTLFYAALLPLLPLMFFPLRRRLRARRGRCPKCNYDLAGLDGPCPECGAAR